VTRSLTAAALVLSEAVVISVWLLFPIVWFLPFVIPVDSATQEFAFSCVDFISKCCAAVSFWYVDVGLIDRTSQLQSSLFEARLAEVHLRELQSFEQSQKALNHAAKRGLSNVHAEMQSRLDEKEPHPADLALYSRVMSICSNSLEICQSVELQRRVSLGEYTIKMDPDIDIERHFMTTLGYEHTSEFELEFQCPKSLQLCLELLTPICMNVVQNAQDHGPPGGPIKFFIMFDDPSINITITNKAGKNHQAMRSFQQQSGPNFLLDGRVYLNAPMRMHGNTYSTFLGMDEIRRCVQAANGSTSIQFYTDTVETKISMPAKAGAAQKVALKKPPKGLIFVMADDDGSMRAASKAIIKKAHGSSNSVVLGKTYEELEDLVSLVLKLAAKYDDSNIVVMLDQNMSFPNKPSVFGHKIIQELRDHKFKGLLCLRTGQTDAESMVEYQTAGAQLILTKSGRHLNSLVILNEIALRLCLQ